MSEPKQRKRLARRPRLSIKVTPPDAIGKVELARRFEGSQASRVPQKTCRVQLSKRARGQWKAFGTGIMMKRSRGRWLKSIAFTTFVRAKLRGQKALSGSRRIPLSIRWKDRKRAFRLRTDVIASQPKLHLQAGAILGPGDGVEFQGRLASVGAALVHPTHGMCVTTAGHLFGGADAIGRVASVVTQNNLSVPVRVKQCIVAQAVDYALLSPAANADCDNLYRDFLRLGPVYVPTANDLGGAVYVLDGFGNAVPTFCRGVDVEMDLPDGHYKDLILTDPCTVGGQSGGCLIDDARRIWGFVLGMVDNTFSIYAPAHVLLSREGAHLSKG